MAKAVDVCAWDGIEQHVPRDMCTSGVKSTTCVVAVASATHLSAPSGSRAGAATAPQFIETQRAATAVVVYDVHVACNDRELEHEVRHHVRANVGLTAFAVLDERSAKTRCGFHSSLDMTGGSGPHTAHCQQATCAWRYCTAKCPASVAGSPLQVSLARCWWIAVPVYCNQSVCSHVSQTC